MNRGTESYPGILEAHPGEGVSFPAMGPEASLLKLKSCLAAPCRQGPAYPLMTYLSHRFIQLLSAYPMTTTHFDARAASSALRHGPQKSSTAAAHNPESSDQLPDACQAPTTSEA